MWSVGQSMVKPGFFHSAIAVVVLTAAFWTAPVTPAAAQLVNQESMDRSRTYYYSNDQRIRLEIDRTGSQTVVRVDQVIRNARPTDRMVRTMTVQSLPAARGDMLLRNEDGDVVLRMTSFGPATYYPEGNYLGIPVIETSEHKTVETATTDETVDVKETMGRYSSTITQTYNQLIYFDVDWSNHAPSADPVLHSAFQTATKALTELAVEDDIRQRVAKGLSRVKFIAGENADLRWQNETLFVYYQDNAGGGFPQAADIMGFIRSAAP